MIFDEKPLREITEADLQAVVVSVLAEHTRLEYKSDLYQNSNHGHKEFLLDIGMFANAQGGVLLVGVAEARDQNGQPTGIPDAGQPLGVAIPNPEAMLLAYGASIEACIEERLTVESHAIPIQPDRFVLAFRIPNSTAKPHCVRYQGHVYFPCRRERHRGKLDIREIKEMTKLVAGQFERAETLLSERLVPRATNEPVFLIGLVPVFFTDFAVDVGSETVRTAFSHFHVRTRLQNIQLPRYSFEGLIREADGDIAILGRNGGIWTQTVIRSQRDDARRRLIVHATAFDVLMRNFVLRAQHFALQVQTPPPFLMRAKVELPLPMVNYDDQGFEDGRTDAGQYLFPSSPVADLSEAFETLIRPFCDLAHQMFGTERSPCFDEHGHWIANL